MLEPSYSDIEVYFLAEGEQTGQEVVARLVRFIHEAQHSLDFALYDFRLGPTLKAMIAEALHERANAGVAIRLVYDADKPENPNWDEGQDPAPAGTGLSIQSLGHPWRRIGGLKLMHHKYVVRDAGTATARVWTGSTNWTDDALTFQENNVIQLSSPELTNYYKQDFEELWASGQIGNSGAFDTAILSLEFAGEPAQVRVLFSPGRGQAIDYEVAYQVAQARRRVRICSMLLNSGALLSALNDLLRIGRVKVDGIYDQTQMRSVLDQWQDVPHNHWKIGAVQDIIQSAGLVGKISTPYSPEGRHDFMHNKVLIIDDTVITGSYNFSHSAQLNAENILRIENDALADRYSRYIDHLIAKYRV